MSDITPGHSYNPGDFVDASDLNRLVGEAVINPSLISDKVVKDPVALSDRILINDNGVLKQSAIQQIVDLVLASAAVPVGAVVDFAGDAAPTGWLLCYGQLVDREAYPDLFLAIGVTYSAGDGTTFGLPDYRGRTSAGKQDMGGVSNGVLGAIISGSVLGATAGVEQHTLTTAQMPSHSHTIPGIIAQGVVGSGVTAGATSFLVNPLSSQSVSSAGGNAAHSNVQPTIIANKIIKALV